MYSIVVNIKYILRICAYAILLCITDLGAYDTRMSEQKGLVKLVLTQMPIHFVHFIFHSVFRFPN